MLIGILGLAVILGLPAIVAWYGWIVPFRESRERSKVGTCYVSKPCGTCRACEHDHALEYTIPTMRDVPALADVQTKNIRIGDLC